LFYPEEIIEEILVKLAQLIAFSLQHYTHLPTAVSKIQRSAFVTTNVYTQHDLVNLRLQNMLMINRAHCEHSLFQKAKLKKKKIISLNQTIIEDFNCKVSASLAEALNTNSAHQCPIVADKITKESLFITGAVVWRVKQV